VAESRGKGKRGEDVSRKPKEGKTKVGLSCENYRRDSFLPSRLDLFSSWDRDWLAYALADTGAVPTSRSLKFELVFFFSSFQYK